MNLNDLKLNSTDLLKKTLDIITEYQILRI